MDSSIANNPAKPLNQIPDGLDPQFDTAVAYGRPQDSPEYIKRKLAFELFAGVGPQQEQLAFEKERQEKLLALITASSIGHYKDPQREKLKALLEQEQLEKLLAREKERQDKLKALAANKSSINTIIIITSIISIGIIMIIIYFRYQRNLDSDL